ncbi:hypothetical protein FHS12_003172 [Nocardioides albus]|uniref:Uncharacterized protein n=1 Tax=Nocardioides albus TaxID=1841 RepID=A0A7W5F9G7_9ACTN|nr:hypothetical protein [Nocardioides albus]
MARRATLPPPRQHLPKHDSAAPHPGRRPDSQPNIFSTGPGVKDRGSGRRSRRPKAVLYSGVRREDRRTRVGGPAGRRRTLPAGMVSTSSTTGGQTIRQRTVLVSTRLRLAAPAARPAGQKRVSTSIRPVDAKWPEGPPSRPHDSTFRSIIPLHHTRAAAPIASQIFSRRTPESRTAKAAGEAGGRRPSFTPGPVEKTVELGSAAPPASEEPFRQGGVDKLDHESDRVGLDTPPPSGSGGSTSGAKEGLNQRARRSRPAGQKGVSTSGARRPRQARPPKPQDH